MIPEYCYDCMSRQAPMNYMQPGMSGGYQQPMQMPYPMQGYTQMPYPMQGQTPMQMDTLGQQIQSDMTGQLPQQFQQGQPGMTGQFPQQFQQGQPGMAGQFQSDQLGGATEGGPDFALEQGPPVSTDINYTQAYLKTKIGQRVKIEFLIGSNMLIDREGTLTEVGISYVVINEVETDDLLLCDIYSIKFVRFYY